MVTACGGDSTGPTPETLNTSVHSEATGAWESGFVAKAIEWRLQSMENAGIRGAYQIEWENQASVQLTVVYSLRFYDPEGFEMARWPLLYPPQRTLHAGASAEDSGNFVLSGIQTISEANQISEMQVWASFIYPELRVLTATLPEGQVGIPYEATLSASGGNGVHTWDLARFSSALPAGLSLSPDGVISGTPTSRMYRVPSFEVTSGDGQSDSRGLPISIK